MEAILRYIYTGETHVQEDNLQSFLQTANLLQIIGLAQSDEYYSRIGEELRGRWNKGKSASVESESGRPVTTAAGVKGQVGDPIRLQTCIDTLKVLTE